MLNVIAGPDGLDPRQPRDLVAATTTSPRSPAAPTACGSVSSPRASATRTPNPAVDDAVRAAVETSCAARDSSAEDVSIPWHLHGARIWDVIATEGATVQMIDANGYGMNWQGLYDPELIEHYGSQWRADAGQFSETVKLVLLAGRYAIDRYHGQVLRDGPQPRAASCAPPTTRRCRALRRAGHADPADPGHGHPRRTTRRARRSSRAPWR